MAEQIEMPFGIDLCGRGSTYQHYLVNKLNNSCSAAMWAVTTTTKTILQLSGLCPEQMGEPVPEETFTHS